MPTLSSTLTFDPKNISDISKETTEKRIAIVREAQQECGQRIFLLNGDVHQKAANMLLGLYDIDDTLTPSGVETLPEEVIEMLHTHRDNGIRSAALTGRHEELIQPLYANHNDDPGLEFALAELGAFRFNPNGPRAYHLSNEQWEAQLGEVRSRMPQIQEELRAKYRGVTFEKNLGGVHQSLDSHSIYLDGIELSDSAILRGIITDIRTQLGMHGWEVRSSSRFTIDIVPGVITKSRAMQKLLQEEGLNASQVGYAEDSNNGKDVFIEHPHILRAAIVGSKTPDELIHHADIATTDVASYQRFVQWVQNK